MTGSFFFGGADTKGVTNTPGRKATKKKWEEYDQKTAKLTPEEQEIRKENLKAREHLDDSGIRQMCAAMCLKAIYDYRNKREAFQAYRASWAGKKRIPKPVQEKLEHFAEDLRELEDFFESDMFTVYTGMEDKEEVVRKISQIPRSYMVLLSKGAL